jgi:hypothetical protein
MLEHSRNEEEAFNVRRSMFDGIWRSFSFSSLPKSFSFLNRDRTRPRFFLVRPSCFAIAICRAQSGKEASLVQEGKAGRLTYVYLA